MSLTKRVAENVKLLRTVRGWSQREVADRCRDSGWAACKREIVANLELGRRSYVSVDEVAILAEVFAVHFYDLVEVDPPSADHKDIIRAFRSALDGLTDGGVS